MTNGKDRKSIKKTIEHVLWARTLPLLESKLNLVLLYKFI